jgi:multimeric flavodoxin WrbA/putative sterol carrier protein
MKVLALNSSARVGDISKTEIMLDHLVQGMRHVGAEVEIINLHKKKIRYCTGCYTCWTKTPGICIHKDDMSREILPKYMDCDLCVLATPLYHFTVNALMKTFIERTLPMAQPFFVKRDGVTHHPRRHQPPPVVILSVAGFPEESVFHQLKSYVNFLFKGRLVAEIYRSASERLRLAETNKSIKDILDAAVQGGKELVESGKISEETLQQIKKPVGDFEKMAPLGNLMWQTCIDEGISLSEFQKRKMIPRPNSLETFLAVMQVAFKPDKADGAKMKIQYKFSGKVKGSCYISIEKGKLTANKGRLKNPDLAIETPFEVWMDILTGKADGAQMLEEDKYTVTGEKDLILNLNNLLN